MCSNSNSSEEIRISVKMRLSSARA